MPEEKKEKFTFSDKIKNSKPAGNKSFAKSSSKIGRDGKPKATLFERTRRDAPFFIAALVALLLLPFLYKYSGQASEEQLLTPGNEQTDFDPERYGFDTAMIEDPDGQIAQLAGRDSLSLIKGWGSNQEEDYGRDDMDLDASAGYDGSAEGEYAAEKHASSEMDVEDNTTNIYKRRAGRATRAAFRRTKVGALSPAGLRRPGGSRLGINNWGGGLKGAAKKVGPSAPASAPKPVSLQPLRAAGSRSGFGQGGAAAARKSKDNMGKSDAREALRDSYVKPVGPTRTGGLDLFSMGPGGGSGKLSRNINITPGKEPWWWDMMKTRMQKEWEARFKRKWDWINWMDNLARNILGGILNCLITGEDDGGMGSFFGHAAGGGKVAKCGELTEEEWKNCKPCMEIGKFGSHTCKTYLSTLDKDSSARKKGWQAGPASGSGAQGFVGVRLNCLGIGGAGAYSGDGTLDEGCTNCLECANMPELYQLNTATLPRKWQKHTYIYVVARNYFPEAIKKRLQLQTPRNLLCTQDHVTIGGNNSSGAAISSIKEERTSTEQEVSSEMIAQMKATGKKQTERQGQLQDIYTADPESVIHGCVIYVQQGDTFNYENFKNAMVQRFAELARKRYQKVAGQSDENMEVDINRLAHDAFLQLDLMFVESFASQNKLAYAKLFESGNRLDGVLPMMYWRFYDAYVRHKKTTHKATGTRTNVDNRKLRKVGEDTAIGRKCYFDSSLRIDCDKPEVAKAIVTVGQGYQGGKSINVAQEAAAKNITVTAEFKPLNMGEKEKTTEQPLDLQTPEVVGQRQLRYSFTDVINGERTKKEKLEGKMGNIRWRVYRKGNSAPVNEVLCPLNLSGDGTSPGVDEKPQRKDPPPIQQEGGMTRLAPQLTWVPCGATDRQAIAASKAPVKSNFGGSEKCYVLKGTDREHCAGSVLEMDSDAAKEFVLSVVDAYNATDPAVKMSNQLSGEHGFPTDGEFLDALNIANTLLKGNAKLQTVSAAAVCEFGRDMVRMSQDKHTGSALHMIHPAETPYGSGKEINNLFHNELGAFLAYVHPQAIFYPQVLTGNGQQCDHRFLVFSHGGCAPMVNWKSQTCIYGGENKCKEYHFVNYNAVPPSLTIAYNAFMKSLTDTQKEAPLAGLVHGKNFPAAHAGAKGGYKAGKNAGPGQKYIEEITGLIREKRGFPAWQGQACENYTTGMPELNVSNVLTYVRGNQGKGGVCNDGLDYKPHGSPGSSSRNQKSAAPVGKNPTGQGS